MDVATISIIIAIVGCLIGISGWVRNTKMDSGSQKATESEIKTTLDFISNDLKEVKVDLRSFSRDLNEVRQIALNADTKAEQASTEAKRANDRLDHLEK